MLEYTFRNIDTCNMCRRSDMFSVHGLRLDTSQGLQPHRKTGVAVTVIKCRSCGLVFANPQPLPNSVEEQYGMSAQEYWNTDHIEADENYFQDEIAILASLGYRFENSRSLDIGAGYGRAMRSLSKKGVDAHGFEPAKAFYELGISRFGIGTDKLKLGTIETAEYEEASFDFITFDSVLEHVHDPDFALKKALRWLKPGGLIHVEVPSSKWFTSKLFNFYYRVRGTRFVTNLSPMHSPFHHFEFTQDSFKKNGLLNGYEVVYETIKVCNTYLPFSFLDQLLKKWMALTGTGMQLVIILRKK